MMEEGQKMKRIRFFAAALICLFLVNIIPVSASDVVDLPKVIDNAELLTDEEEAELTGLINTIVTQYQIDVVLVTETQRQEADVQAEADMLFDSNGYGIGEKKDGVLFLVDMGAGEWSISTHGDVINLLSDYDMNALGQNAAQSYFSNGQFGAGFKSYLEALTQKFEEKLNPPADSQNAVEGSPDTDAGRQTAGNQPSNSGLPADKQSNVQVEEAEAPKTPAAYIVPALILGLIISAVYMVVMRLGMKTAYKQQNADVYRRKDVSAQIRRNDVLLTSDVKKVPVKQQRQEPPGNYNQSRYQEPSERYDERRRKEPPRRQEPPKRQNTSKYSETHTTVHTSRNGEKHGGASGRFTQEKPKQSKADTTVHTSRSGEKHGGGSGKF